MFQRKILSALLSGIIFALFYSILGGFDWELFFILYFLNLMFVITYGVAASLLSDFIASKVFERKLHQEIFSFSLHCFFGAGMLIFSMSSAAAFFLVDRYLRKKTIHWWMAGVGVAIAAITFAIVMFIFD